MKEASARVNLLLSKSCDLLTRAKAIETSDMASRSGDNADDAAAEQQSLREKLAEALVSLL
jgi:hypothetical protein